MTPTSKRQLRRRSAIEPRNYLWYRQGNAINAVLAAAGYNFRRLLRRLELLLSQILIRPIVRPQLMPSGNP